MPKGVYVRKSEGNRLGDKCRKCGVVLTALNCTYVKKFYIRSVCVNCRKDQVNNWASHNRDVMYGHNITRYGITVEEYNKKLALQLEGCAICKKPCQSGQRLGIDHNHKTKQIRDLLCKKCNVIIGLVNEDEDYLFDILEYLKRHELKKGA